MPYCGVVINMKNLNMQLDFSENLQHVDLLSATFQKNAGNELRKKMMKCVKKNLQFHFLLCSYMCYVTSILKKFKCSMHNFILHINL